MRIGTHAVADELRKDGRASAAGMFSFFQHQDACAFADDEAVARHVPRAARPRRVVVARRERAHGRKSGDAQRRDAGFRAAADHRVGIAVLDQASGIANRVRAGRARGRGRRVRALGAQPHRDLARRQVHDRGQDEEGRDAIGSALEQDPVFALDDLEAADAAADDDADALVIVRIDP